MMQFSRAWAMPSPNTFSIPPIKSFVDAYLSSSVVSIDPFARNHIGATHSNDLNPLTCAEFHVDALVFLDGLASAGVRADLVILDPPYSPRQIANCYEIVGRPRSRKNTQIAGYMKQVRKAAAAFLEPGGVVLSFGWNSVGMGKSCASNEVEKTNMSGWRRDKNYDLYRAI